MAQFCTSCGKAITEGSPFCTICGAPQTPTTPIAAPAAPIAAPAQAPVIYQAPAPRKASPVVKVLVVVFGVIALGMVVAMGSCFFIAYRLRNKAKQYTAALNGVSGSSQPASAPGGNLPDLAGAMTKLGDSLQNPSAPVHVSFKKSGSDGFSYSLEADVSPNGISGQETDVSPETGTGGAPSGGTSVYPRNAARPGTPEWTTTVGEIELAYLNPTMNGIRDAQAGMKYVGDEQAGGFDARRYDFDLATAPASAKLPTLMAGKWLGAVTSGATGKRVLLKDYNVKGSAWLAKDDGRMVKFQYDYISIFDDGTQKVTHSEGVLTRK